MAVNYWKDKQQKLVERWCETKSEGVRTRTYNQLYPAVRYMTEQIMQRYFSIPQAQFYELRHDVIQNLFLKLDRYNKGKSTAYSFCSVLIKHSIWDMAVRKLKSSTPRIEYSDDMDVHSDGLHHQTPDSSPEAILRFVGGKMDIAVKSLAKYSPDNQKCNKLNKKIEMMKTIMEFIEKYGVCDIKSIFDYVRFNTSIHNLKTISRYLAEIMGVSTRSMQMGDIKEEDKDGSSIIDDDHCPGLGADEMYGKRSLIKKMKKNGMEIQYF